MVMIHFAQSLIMFELFIYAYCFFSSPVDFIERRARSRRSDYGRFTDSKSKSGSGAKKMTAKSTWKKNRWSFVAPYIVKRKEKKGGEMGQTPEPVAGPSQWLGR